ncbi:MAG: tRNA (adenosine(37)-N6)-threonylcarbamoyltransferase complex ATPase subunit type 1 TsaE [Burkholderiaceae bacterium]|nr:tRNA (adenosine(37)-N6)-threonylcarbamoyltransferase complex ATPase subunit type 1 TsaE [Burkholderiaceae bacterium]
MPSTQDHPPILETRHVIWADEAACAATARTLAQCAAVREAVIELRGPLGAGKTTFVRHLLHALGVTGRVKSPTYAVLEAYELSESPRAGPIWHFDFYRFNDPQEWEDAGFRDIYAGAGLKIAEWPEKAEGLLPAPDLRIEIDFQSRDAAPGDDADDANGGARVARFTACTARGRGLLP